MQERITTDPNICEGRACIRDTRVPASLLLDQLAAGQSTREIVENNPSLQPEDITAALTYAANLTRVGVTAAPVTTIHYHLTAGEVVRGLMKYRRTPGQRVLFLLGGFGVLLLVQGYYLPGPEESYISVPGYALVILSVLLYFYRPLALRRAMAKIIQKNPVYSDPKEVAFDEKGLVVSSPGRKSEVAWTTFKKLTQDTDYFYLHTDTLGTVMQMPKNAFDAAALERFLRFSQSLAQP